MRSQNSCDIRNSTDQASLNEIFDDYFGDIAARIGGKYGVELREVVSQDRGEECMGSYNFARLGGKIICFQHLFL